MRDDYVRSSGGPGWLGVIFTSLLTSCAVLIAFVWALSHGVVRIPALDAKPREGAAASDVAHAAAHVSVPSLIGLPATTARELLTARGLRLVVRQKRAYAAPEGSVIAQDPLSDSELPRDGAVVVVLSSGPPASVAVPELAGKALPEALKQLETAGLSARDLAPDAGADSVVSGSEPAAGAKVDLGSGVKLTLTPAGIEVPKLTGLTLTKAKKALQEARLSLGKVKSRYDEEISAYVILTQSPEAGARVPRGTPIDLVYSEE